MYTRYNWVLTAHARQIQMIVFWTIYTHSNYWARLYFQPLIIIIKVEICAVVMLLKNTDELTSK